MTCKTCIFWDVMTHFSTKGCCLLSKEDNGFMTPTDDWPDDPYLETDEKFGCNQWREIQ